MGKNKNVLISVFDKKKFRVNIKIFNEKIYHLFNRCSSEYLKKIRIPHVEVSEYTKQKEILSGRVKNTSKNLYGILAANTLNHQKEIKKEKIINFDLIIVNLYPFEKQ